MKKGILILAAIMLVACFAGPANAGFEELLFGQSEEGPLAAVGCNLSLTMLSGPDMNEDNEYTFRGGIQNGRLEIGPTVSYVKDKDLVYGVYITRQLTDDKGLGLLGKPYVGFEAVVSGDGYCFLSGTVYDISPGIELLTEISVKTYGEETEDFKVKIGPKIRF